MRLSVFLEARHMVWEGQYGFYRGCQQRLFAEARSIINTGGTEQFIYAVFVDLKMVLNQAASNRIKLSEQ